MGDLPKNGRPAERLMTRYFRQAPEARNKIWYSPEGRALVIGVEMAKNE